MIGSLLSCIILTFGVINFRLEPVNNVHRLSNQDMNYASEEQIKCDLRYLYDTLLHPQTMVEFRSQATSDKMIDAATKILDCKHFIKDYSSSPVNPFAVYLWCHVELSDEANECPSPPPELLVFPLKATVSDLKTEVAKAFQEVYAMFKSFEVEELLGYSSMDDSITLKFLIGTNGVMRVKGDAHLKKDSSNTAWREGWRTGKSIASVAQRMMMVRGCWPVICVVCGTTLDVRGLKMPMHYLPSSIVSDALNCTARNQSNLLMSVVLVKCP